jgi:Fe-S-cluster containining protein
MEERVSSKDAVGKIEIDTDTGLLTAEVGNEQVVVDLNRPPGTNLRVLVQDMVHDLLGRKDTGGQDNCDHCIGACCTGWRINLGASDVVRLAEGLGKPYDYVVDNYTDPSFDLSGDGRGLQLRHVADDRFPKGSRCKFLGVKVNKDKIAVGRCTIYEHRPETCREYPAYNCDEFIPAARLYRRDEPTVEKRKGKK